MIARPYSVLVRRIGYSVGLEHLVERVITLTEFYVRERSLSYATWSDLVRGFGRTVDTRAQKGAQDHIADVFSSLKIISFQEKKLLFPSVGLDVLSILRCIYSDDVNFRKAVRATLLFLILDADGDVFFNCLLVGFSEERLKRVLPAVFQLKREKYLSLSTSPSVRNVINNIVRIRTIDSEANSEWKGAINNPAINQSNTLSPDYLRKVPATRKSWAVDLDLFDPECNVITEEGSRLLAAIIKLCGGAEFGGCPIWPYKDELINLRMSPAHAIPSFDRWDLLTTIQQSLFVSRSALDSNDVLTVIQYVDALYKEANRAKRMIRHQLPGSILELALYAIGCVEMIALPVDLNAILDYWSRTKERPIDIVSLRNKGKALLVRRTR
jgi:hypothetical protein